ncbi:MAG: hypothetical protein EXR98_11745 [Gemmataceae bacterium]|nr:hypothetical protein [Gemmataceae bacterium]
MIAKILSTYRQITIGSLRAAPSKRSAYLQVVPLEERATPTAASDLLPPVQPVQMVWIAPILSVDMLAPVAGAVVNAGATEANVRADLFCSSDCDDTPQLDDVWEDWFMAPESCKVVPATTQQEPQQEASGLAPEVALNEVRVVFSVAAEEGGAAAE